LAAAASTSVFRTFFLGSSRSTVGEVFFGFAAAALETGSASFGAGVRFGFEVSFLGAPVLGVGMKF